MARQVWACTLAVLAGCAPPSALQRADLAGTVWREVCPDAAIVPAAVELRIDGLLGWSYAEPDVVRRQGFRLDTLHTWAVTDGALAIRWNLGSARSLYRPTERADVMAADSSTFCLAGLTLVRLW